MATKVAECSSCGGIFSKNYVINLMTSSDERHQGRIVCRRCRNEMLYPGGTRDGKWYQRFLNKVRNSFT